MRHLPSAVTLLGLLCGAAALLVAPSEPLWGAWLVIAAGICDMLDGRLARLLKAQSALGAQLDSLADMVSFGVAPAGVAWAWAWQTEPGWTAAPVALGLAAFVGCAALRLARFNLEDAPTGTHFVGMPTPAGALLLITWVMVPYELPDRLPEASSFWGVTVIALLAGACMVSSVPFGSWKVAKRGWLIKGFYVAIAAGLTTLLVGGPGGTILFAILALYTLWSLVRRGA